MTCIAPPRQRIVGSSRLFLTNSRHIDQYRASADLLVLPTMFEREDEDPTRTLEEKNK